MSDVFGLLCTLVPVREACTLEHSRAMSATSRMFGADSPKLCTARGHALAATRPKQLLHRVPMTVPARDVKGGRVPSFSRQFSDAESRERTRQVVLAAAQRDVASTSDDVVEKRVHERVDREAAVPVEDGLHVGVVAQVGRLVTIAH